MYACSTATAQHPVPMSASAKDPGTCSSAATSLMGFVDLEERVVIAATGGEEFSELTTCRACLPKLAQQLGK
jgi:hypothetical protein